MSQLSSIFGTVSLFVGSVYSHSWLHCSDYSAVSSLNGGGTFSDDNCNGYIRQWSSIWGATTFGADRGINYQPSGDWCQSAFSSDLTSMYDDGYAMAEWAYGDVVTLVWPAKNHANYECTDNIPDNSMKLFYNNNANPNSQPSYSSGVGNPTGDGWTQLIDWQADCTAGSDGCGFQNCPNYCADTGLAPCWQQYTVSSSDFSSTGIYTLMWYWEFNAGSYYTTCFEVEITGTSAGDDDDDDDDDDDTSGSSGSESFDDYLIQIPIRYSGADYNEDTLITGANKIELDDTETTFSFAVIAQSGATQPWNVTIQTNTNKPGNIFNAAYDYTSTPEGDSELCDKVVAEFGAGTCEVIPGEITTYGESSSGSSRIYGNLDKFVFVSIALSFIFGYFS